MGAENLKDRTKKFALRVIEFVESLPSGKTINVIGRQLLRSGTSVGANYRSACRAKSRADFINKLNIVEEEADESLFWMELLIESNLVKTNEIKPLYDEANELLSIVIASIKTAKKKK
jgi:four helix bundle protein